MNGRSADPRASAIARMSGHQLEDEEPPRGRSRPWVCRGERRDVLRLAPLQWSAHDQLTFKLGDCGNDGEGESPCWRRRINAIRASRRRRSPLIRNSSRASASCRTDRANLSNRQAATTSSWPLWTAPMSLSSSGLRSVEPRSRGRRIHRQPANPRCFSELTQTIELKIGRLLRMC